MSLLEDYILTLENLGLLDVLLPFLLIFTIAFAVLQKSKVLGEHARKFNIIVSFVLAMAAVIPHVIGRGPDVVSIINQALPSVSLLMIASMMTLLLIGVFGNDVNIAGTPLVGIVVVFSIIAVGWTFLASAGVLGQIPFLSDPETRSMLVSILVFGLIVWFITSEQHPADARESRWDTISNIFGGRGGGGHH